MSYWHCHVCDFNVFNSKNKCFKCLTKKPTQKTGTFLYDSDFDKQTCKYFQEKSLNEKTSCSKCILDGRTFIK